jgi:anti-sigma factor RsiW
MSMRWFWNSCRRYRRLIWASLDGDLGKADSEALSGHLAGCPACRAEQARADAGDALVRGFFEQTAREDGPDDGFWDRLSGRLAEDAPVRKARTRRAGIRSALELLGRRRVWVPVAVCVMILGLWGARGTWREMERDTEGIVQEKRELEQIQASLQEMEAELDGLYSNWN